MNMYLYYLICMFVLGEFTEEVWPGGVSRHSHLLPGTGSSPILCTPVAGETTVAVWARRGRRVL